MNVAAPQTIYLLFTFLISCLSELSRLPTRGIDSAGDLPDTLLAVPWRRESPIPKRIENADLMKMFRILGKPPDWYYRPLHCGRR